ncbi:DUF5067 domain-containing protein [Levilactobacillus bambusae]|uniref:DUF5067 domain-containing protein n=1 Tax=Levilactobacillus bambusae TaxID=2024736 RepID=A0A2V1MX81_9LACO|nr:DUF5067 domain-containing protein [Levilactobacillus bambusae]PWF99471.1 DUF5067 domain-containing protein [Levilactobacillus bambusae]
MKLSNLLMIIISGSLLLAGCQVNQQSSESKTSSLHAAKTKTAVPATFRQQTFTVKNEASFTLTNHAVENSSTKNRQLLVIRMTVKNLGKREFTPADVWSKYVWAEQDGKRLTTGNLAFSTNQTSDNNLMNRSVMPVKPGQSAKILATFEPKTKSIINVHFTNQKNTIHVSRYTVR